MDWNDLRYFLETERTGRMSRAARRLGVSHTTVARHMERLEAAAGAPLFERNADGLELTETGRQLRHHAEAMERAALAAQEVLRGVEGGKVRIGAPDGIGNAVISHLLPRLARTMPELELALVPLPVSHKLWRRDVDLAITLDRPQTGRLVMRKLIDYDLRLYGAPEYLADHPAPDGIETVAQHPFVGYVDDILYTAELDFSRAFGPDLRVVYKGATVKAQLDAVRAGVGLGVLPCFMAEGTELTCILPDTVQFQRAYWLIFPEEYRDLARIRTVADFLVQEVQSRAAQFRAP